MTTQGMDLGAPRQLKDAVYLQLRDDIISGALPTGAVLREAELEFVRRLARDIESGALDGIEWWKAIHDEGGQPVRNPPLADVNATKEDH